MAHPLDISDPHTAGFAKTTVETLHESGSETASGNSSSVDLTEYSEAVGLLDVTAADTTDGDETLDVKFQTSDNDTDWYDLGDAFAQINSVTTPDALKMTNLGKYVRAVWTIGGTTPDFTFSLKLVAKS